MKKVFLLVLAWGLFINCIAQSNTASSEQLLRFVRAIGVDEQVERQRVALQARAAQTAQQYVEQIKTAMPGLPEQFEDDLEEEMQIYLSNVYSSIDAGFLINSYMSLMAEKLTAEEIVELTEFYESELGKKYVASVTEITDEWISTFMNDFDENMAVHVQTFIDNLLSRIRSYN